MTTEIAKKTNVVKLDSMKKANFIKKLSELGSIKAAAAVVGVTVGTISNHVSKDPIFADAVEIAKNQYLALLEEELHQRAVTGKKKQIWFQGRVVGEETVVSDKLLELLITSKDDSYKKGSANVLDVNIQVTDAGSSAISKLASFLKLDKQQPIDIEDAEYTSSDDEEEQGQE